ncbi:MAG: DnaJ family domain-containing protein [Syntrophomonadales bacterium]|jgi:DnaJ family protein C protein 28
MGDDRSLEEEIKIKAGQARSKAKYMASMEDLVEEKIRKAIESGSFDNLEGKGKPLNLQENPFEPPDMRMANKILKDAGFSPYWMELGKDVDAAIEKFWQDVDKFITVQRIKRDGGKRNQQYAQMRMNKFLKEAETQLRNINRLIDNFNCHCPMWWLGRGRLNINQEMARVREKLQESINEND